MKILYLSCAMGAAGDMLAAALSDLLDGDADFAAELSGLNIPGTSISISDVTKNGVSGKSFEVYVNGESESDTHSHHGHCMHDIEDIVTSLNTTDDVKQNILSIYKILAEAEGRVHKKDVRELHFHEVGMLDAVADIAAVCIAMKHLAPEKVYVSPVHVGSGNVKCAHGILPVPAPATAEILKGIPIFGGKVNGELCTPTGAALLKFFADEFGDMPVISTEKTGYGMGKRDFDELNCVRAFLGYAEKASELCELRANIDDMTGEEIAHACKKLLEAGALDVWTENIGMKKSRPGVTVCMLCKTVCSEEMSRLMFQHTSTLGVREIKCTRRELSREITEAETPFGRVRKKISEGFGVSREKYEFSDLEKIAEENGLSIMKVKEILSREG
ncbi:MAG: nickel pincer cofactor biosynthesis protein LarC [Oscillospiraceae bacterium]|nr:nickel pincer cofactor biosynthesis protein LarC [Oscillospiraceae bacterium]